jgi:hypothetical protein
MDERTTAELIEKLGDDVARCHAGLIEAIDEGGIDRDGGVSADYEYHARQLIRSILAYIEGVTFSVKIKCVDHCLRAGIEVSDNERYLAVEVDPELNEKGEVVERSSKLRLMSNIRFAFRLFEKASKHASRFDPGSEWWSCLHETVRVRDRLTHPKMPADIEVSGEEIVKALKARSGFEQALMGDGFEWRVGPPKPGKIKVEASRSHSQSLLRRRRRRN